MNRIFGRELGSIISKGAVELLLGFPLLLTVAAYAFPSKSSPWLWLLSLLLCHVIGYAGGSLLSLRKKYQLLLFVLAIGSVGSLLIFGTSYEFYFAMPIAAILAARGARLAAVPWNVLFPVSFYGIGLLTYLAGSLIWPLLLELQPYVPWLLWSGLAALAVTLLNTNQSNMKQETLSGDREPVLASAVVWQNRILVLIAFAVIVIIVLFRKLQQAVIWLKEQLLAWIRELLSRTSEPPHADKAQQAPANLSGLGGGGQPAAWLVWLEKAFIILVEAVVVVVFLFLFYIVIRRLAVLVKKLYVKLMDFLTHKEARRGNGGYEDDVESLMDWHSIRNQMKARMKKWLPRPSVPQQKWEDLLDNRERVRYLYRIWIQKAVSEGYMPQRYLTPREIALDMKQDEPAKSRSLKVLIKPYEQVRYGDKQVEDAEVGKMKIWIEKNKSD